MSFFSKKEKPSVPAGGNNPYLNAREEWLERYGSYISRAAQWRSAAFVTLAVALLSLTCNVIQATQVKTVPYIIEVDKLGKSIVVNRADKASATPLRLIQAEIAGCIQQWRTVTADIELQQQMIQRLSFFFAGSAKGVLKEWYANNNPYEIAKAGRLVPVEIKSLRSHAGATLDSSMYEATVTIQITPPASEAVLIHNPGGVYITQLSASRILAAQRSN